MTLDEPWLVDVGFGYSFVEPLRLVPEIEQADPLGAFRLCAVDGGLDLEWRHRDGRWAPHFRLDPLPHDLAEFDETSRFHQTDPGSPFTRGWNCVVMREPTARRRSRGATTSDRRRRPRRA